MALRTTRAKPVADDPRLIAAMQEYLAAMEAGHPPPRNEFLAQHAAIATELSDCLDGLEMVQAATTKRRPAKVGPAVAKRAAAPRTWIHRSSHWAIFGSVARSAGAEWASFMKRTRCRWVAAWRSKVLPFAASLDPSRLERFKHEAQAAAQLHHTNIVPVYSVGIERGVHFYAMQLIEGQSLSVVHPAIAPSDGPAKKMRPHQYLPCPGGERPFGQ